MWRVSRPKRRQRKDAQERLKHEVERLRRELAERDRQIAEQAKQIAKAEKQIVDLERQLALRQQNSTTTSKPPSSDGLAGRPRERGRRKRSRRNPGGQPGHPGHTRPLVPADRVKTTVDLVPQACRHCERRLHARDEVGDPRRHQVTELPPIEPQITEYRCHRLRCRACGHTTQASLPDEVVGQFGPQLTALIAYLTVVCRLPRLVVQRLLEARAADSDQRGQHAERPGKRPVPRSRSRIRNSRRRCRTSAVLNADETGHRTNGDKRWIWTLVARTFIFYQIATSRGVGRAAPSAGADVRGHSRERSVAHVSDLRGQPASVLLVAFHEKPAQRAGAGEDRRGQALLPRGPRPAEAPLPALASLSRRSARARRAAHAPATDHEGPADREGSSSRLADRSRQRAERAMCEISRARCSCILPHFFTFVYEEGVEPTNNAAERALRTAVQWRKIMFGTRSETAKSPSPAS